MRATFCSFRLGGRDGVSVEVSKWQRAFRELGWLVSSVAGSGTADLVIEGLALDAASPPDPVQLESALTGADLVVVDNLCSLPLNPAATEAVARVLKNRPALLRHHDLVWQHPRWARAGWQMPGDPAWHHVVISEMSRTQMAQRGLEATTIYNSFPLGPAGQRDPMRQKIGVQPDEILLLHPTRAIERKNIPAALELAAALGATYWLTGEAEQDYGPTLERLLSGSGIRTLREPAECMADAYAACDAVVFPSTWEGFGNPPVEAAVHRRPAAVGRYPVASELVDRFGFGWFPSDDPTPLATFLRAPDPGLVEHNRFIAAANFSAERLPSALADVLRRWGW